MLTAELADREAIRTCIYRNARAIDRCDAQLLAQVFWPEAAHTGMGVTLPIDRFLAMAIPSLRGYGAIRHQIGNILIELKGTLGVAESYFHGYHRYTEDGRERDNIQAGRYLDRFERRQGEWRMIERTVVVDWFRDYDDSADWNRGPFGLPVVRGERCPDDRSYALFASLS